jgi:hypothetical protein
MNLFLLLFYNFNWIKCNFQWENACWAGEVFQSRVLSMAALLFDSFIRLLHN